MMQSANTHGRTRVWITISLCVGSLTVLPAAPASADRGVYQAVTTGFSDTWDTNFGALKLTQSGSRVTGTMTEASNPRVVGNVTGTLTNGRLSGAWSVGSKRGTFANLTLDARSQSFTGSATGYTTWCGARQRRPLPSGCAFSGQWTIELNGAGTGTATLTQIGATVSGSYSTKLTSGKFTGSVAYVNGLPILSGKWSSARTGGLFKAYLTGFDARQFQGNFDGKLAFCGWRSGAAKSATCLKS